MQKSRQDVQVPEVGIDLPKPYFGGYSYIMDFFSITLQNDNYPYYGIYEEAEPASFVAPNDGESFELLYILCSETPLTLEELGEKINFEFSPATSYIEGCVESGYNVSAEENCYTIALRPLSSGHWSGNLEVKYSGKTLLTLENLSINVP